MLLWRLRAEHGWLPLQDGLAEPQQFCDIMVTGRLEEFLQPGLRSQKYAAIEPQRLVTVLAKYR